MSRNKREKQNQLGPPPRWLHCPCKGQIIIDKFIPFKTPLDERYNGDVPEECRFNFDMLFAFMKSYRKNLGLVVDLTNTTRFYDSKKLEETNDCKYVKIQCRGHGETPSKEQTQAFLDLCSRFINQKPLEVIGVHCTHGFNRTGFLIVAYLVERMDWSVEVAVKTFAETRPPGIYKQDYLQELFFRYGDIDDTPPAPPLPDWCNEPDELDDDGNLITINDDTSSADSPRKRGRKEIMKKFHEGVTTVVQVTDQPRLGNVQKKVQVMCEWKGSGFPGSQPITMDINNLDFLRKKPYKCSLKSDGTRYMMLIDGENQVYMLDRDNTVFHVPNLQFPKRKDLEAHLVDTLIDGEMINDEVNGQNIARYLVYDIVKFEGQDVGKTDLNRRLLCIEKEIIGARNTNVTQGLLDKSREPFSVRATPFWDVVTSRKILEGDFANQVSHKVDGLIFQPVLDPYHPGRCQYTLKWKPPELNSVDFKLKIITTTAGGLGFGKILPAQVFSGGKPREKPGWTLSLYCPIPYHPGRCQYTLKWKPPNLNFVDFKLKIITNAGGLGMPKTKKALLYVTGMAESFAEMKFSKDVKELDNKIVECCFDHTVKNWKYMRERTDKSFPNHYTTAIAVCESIRHPVTKELLFRVTEVERWMPLSKPSHSMGPPTGLPPPKRHKP